MCTRRKATGEYVLACFMFATMFYQLTGSTTGYPLAIMVTPLQKKINKCCSFSVFRFSITVDAVFNPYVLVS